MDYEPYDSSGTDDDLPPSHTMPRGRRVAGNGRPAVASAPYSQMYDTDMETQIHQLEQEAYSSVLRAFKAQADAISWEKESLITELRKELRLSNEEHRELLAQVNANDTIRRIREWRQAGGLQSNMFAASHVGRDTMSSPTVSASVKKQKTNQSMPSQSFGGPSPQFHAQASAPHQSSSMLMRKGSMTSSKGKKQKPGLPGASLLKSMQYASSDPSGRGQVVNRVPSGAAILNELGEGAAPESLVGKRVRTRWPDDNTFYQAVITHYNVVEGRHALVYDMGTANETWEWINLSEISPEDIELVGEDPGISNPRGYSGHGNGMNKSIGPNSIPGPGRGRGLPKAPSRKDVRPLQNGYGRKTPQDIRIRNTEIVIKQVERVFGADHPDRHEIEEAKKVLQEHEQALINAIARLGDMSDGESGTPF